MTVLTDKPEVDRTDVALLVEELIEIYTIRKMDPRPIYFGFWYLMINTTKLD